MHFLFLILAVVPLIVDISCLSLAGDESNLVARHAYWKTLLGKNSTVTSSRQPIPKKKCTRENISVRKEWFILHALLFELESHLTHSRRTLSTPEKKSYIDAVLCLQSIKPALYENDVRGTSSRYEDFQVVHINQSFIIHINVYLSMAHKDQPV